MEKESLTEKVLKKAIIEICEIENAAYDKETAKAKEHEFSNKFKNNMKKMIEK